MSGVGENSTRIRKIIIKSYKLIDLAKIYEMTAYRMRRSLKPHNARIGNKDGYFYTAEQVTLIFRLIKLPSNVEVVKA